MSSPLTPIEIAENIKRDYKGSYMLARAADLLVEQHAKISTLEQRNHELTGRLIEKSNTREVSVTPSSFEKLEQEKKNLMKLWMTIMVFISLLTIVVFASIGTLSKLFIK